MFDTKTKSQFFLHCVNLDTNNTIVWKVTIVQLSKDERVTSRSSLVGANIDYFVILYMVNVNRGSCVLVSFESKLVFYQSSFIYIFPVTEINIEWNCVSFSRHTMVFQCQ